MHLCSASILGGKGPSLRVFLFMLLQQRELVTCVLGVLLKKLLTVAHALFVGFLIIEVLQNTC
jgi:hypothetical protein